MYAFNALEGIFDLVSAAATPSVATYYFDLEDSGEFLLENGDYFLLEAGA